MKGMAKFWKEESAEKSHKDIKGILEKKAALKRIKSLLKKHKKGDCPT